MIQTDISDVLSKLKSLSDSTDLIIYQHNRENELVDKWFTTIKENALAIINNKKSSLSSASECPEIPDLVSSIKGEQLRTKKNRVSSLLAVARQDHARLSHRRSRASLRKIILEKKKDNQWEISNSKSSADQKREKEPSTQIKGRVSRSSANVSPRRTTSDIKTTENSKVEDSYSTPQQNQEVLVPNSDDKTPVTRSKTRDINPLKKLKQVSPNEKYRTQVLTPDIVQKKTDKILTTDAQAFKYDNKSVVADQTCKIDADSSFTPQNETIILDDSSDESEESKPRTRSKRKSSFQLTQKLKKARNSSTESQTTKQTTRNHHEDSVSGSQYSKKIRLNKNAKNAVIQPKASGVTSQTVTTGNEKRILREIQKKEEAVSENTKKLRTLRQKKIEESKKNRELKMEKAMQQRMKIESEKKERMKCRSISKQENVQQKELSVKKTAQRKIQTEEKAVIVKKITPTSSQKMNQPTAPKSLQNEKAPSSTPKKAPPRPVRTPVKAELSPTNVKETEKRLLNQTFTNPSAEALSSSKDVFVKPSPLNTTYVAKACDLPSTPTVKKSESKTVSKTPVSSLNKKNNSYTMTPAESSFVSYDVSEIKSDDSDGEESSNNKPIPSWASGVRLRNALLNQQYNNTIDTTELFGNYFETPDLGKIMGVEKKHYFKRTSSAIWINSPNRSLLY